MLEMTREMQALTNNSNTGPFRPMSTSGSQTNCLVLVSLRPTVTKHLTTARTERAVPCNSTLPSNYSSNSSSRCRLSNKTLRPRPTRREGAVEEVPCGSSRPVVIHTESYTERCSEDGRSIQSMHYIEKASFLFV